MLVTAEAILPAGAAVAIASAAGFRLHLRRSGCLPACGIGSLYLTGEDKNREQRDPDCRRRFTETVHR
jgi:hypothetical protein